MIKYIKSLLILVISMSIVLNSIAFAEEGASAESQAEATVSTSTKTWDAEREFLKSVGVISIEDSSLYKKVTNTEFAMTISKILNANATVDSASALNLMLQSQYMLSENSIADDAIQFSQVVKYLTSILGYDIYAKNDGFTVNYMLLTSEKGLLKGLSLKADDGITNNDFIKLIYNALHIDMLVQTSFGVVNNYKISKGETLLSKYLKIHKSNARVTANEFTSLSGKNQYRENKIELGGILFDCEKDYNDYLGYNVTYYYDASDENNKKIVYLCSDEAKNKVIKVDNDDFISCIGQEFSYIGVGGNTETVDLNDGYCIVYNNRALETPPVNIFDIENGYFELIDTNNDDYNDFVKITSYETIVVGTISTELFAVYDKYDNSKSIKLDSSDKDLVFTIHNASNNVLEFSSIKKGNVLSICESLDGKVVSIYLSEKSIKGMLKEKTVGSSKMYVTIDESRYLVSQSYVPYLSELKIGDKNTLYVDSFGKIAGANTDSNSKFILGYIIKNEAKSGMFAKGQLKIFAVNKKTMYLDIADKAKVDGEQYRKSIDAYSALFDRITGELKSRLISFGLNEKGEINQIDTANLGTDESSASLHLVSPSELRQFVNSPNTFDFKIVIGEDTKIFIVPTGVIGVSTEEMEDEKNYYIKSNDYFVEWDRYQVESYSFDKDSRKTDVLLCFQDTTLPVSVSDKYTTDMMVYESSARVLDDEGTEMLKVQGYNLYNDMKVSLICTNLNLFDGIKNGDIINYELNLREEIGAIQLIYDQDSANPYKFNSPSILPFASTRRFIHGKVALKGNDFIKVQIDKFPTNVVTDDSETYSLLSSPKIYSYDKKAPNKKVSKATSSSIYDYVSTNNDCSEVFAYTKSGSLKVLVIFK